MKVQDLLDTIENYTELTKEVSGSREKIREIIRHYYNYTCQSCGEKWEVGNRRFDIHHKDCNKDKTRKVDRYEDLDNLICLCHTCHFQQHYNHNHNGCRKNWKEIFAENFEKAPQSFKDKFLSHNKSVEDFLYGSK